ncbi:2'-5' RNA ligase family protein [Clostridium botulinum]|uniref:Phosphoesterase n=1 Tax=Clostridium botulinum TaxID=1491 RepID=A0A9Q1UZA7_CLOBO|nr:2'-5' RNA ligase family protein [Clostridium botulinum]AEB75281.1 putative phosphoesterase, HXTX [Clostridium botulinum BKT015925]KEI02270.1 phosphoesterase [Clostridium botulinum D str. 16868]KEI03233.1 phosphoesterase [Clostridium botulinum C/D str. Sp77]KLU75074.1 phosphoesterase [Clostridium botulinum V891]KOA75047.1 phosphoesterase [Clostridium botulinum]
MKRYVIVSLIHGDVQKVHEKLVQEISSKFNVRPQTLPMHITLKAPFEIENINEVEQTTEKFCNKNNRVNIDIKGIGHFRDNVIFMDVIPSKEAIHMNKDYYKELKKIKNLQWSNNEGEKRKFHCTLASKNIKNKFRQIWNFVINEENNFSSIIDNIAIMEYNFRDFKWDLYKKFKLK